MKKLKKVFDSFPAIPYFVAMTLIQYCNKPLAPAIGEAIRNNMVELDNVQAGVGVNRTFSGARWNGLDGRNGLRNLILEVLQEAGKGLSSRQILRASKAKFPTVGRYPYASFRHYLANVLAKSGEVQSVALARTGGRGRPGFVWVIGPAAKPVEK